MRRVIAILGFILLAVASPMAAQTPPPAPPAEPQAPAEPQPTDQEKIDAMLQEEEQVLEGSGFTYDPGTRRDPFKSLLAGQDKPLLKGPRPEGIPGLMIDEVKERVAERKVDIEVTQTAKDELVREGFDPVYGARPLRRTVVRRIENPLAKRILSGEFSDGDTVRVDFHDGDFTFEKAPQREAVAV